MVIWPVIIRRTRAEGIVMIFTERRVVRLAICHQTTELRRTQEVAMMKPRCKLVNNWLACKHGRWDTDRQSPSRERREEISSVVELTIRIAPPTGKPPTESISHIEVNV